MAKKTRFVEPNLAEHWRAIAGAEIATLCRPGRITGIRGGRSLEVVVASGAAAAQLQQHADALKKQVNNYLGPNAVARILIRQNAAAIDTGQSRDPAAAASPLHDALSAFARSIGKKP